MEDERLRELIEEIKDCRYLSDKIAILREQVHSLYDLVELLDTCFYDEEYDEVFQLLSKAELSVLQKSITGHINPEELSDFVPEKEWQARLLAL